MGASREHIVIAVLLLCSFAVTASGHDKPGSGFGVARSRGARRWPERDSVLTSLALSASTRPAFDRAATKTDRPVVGILTLPVDIEEEKAFGTQTLPTSYVRFVQAGGARVVPIFYDSTKAELDNILNKVNGVLWTGSAVSFNPSDDESEGHKYHLATEYILRHVIRENQRGNYYPFWGTCLGFERLMELLLQDDSDVSVLEETDATDFPTNLDFMGGGMHSRMFQTLSRNQLSEAQRPGSHIIFNNHQLGVRPAALDRTELVKSAFKIVSTCTDRNGKVFISSIEGSHMPIYGTQWHPEKSAWEWKPVLHPSHSNVAIQLSNAVGQFFVQECKYNSNSFPTEEDENAALIQHWFSYPTSNLSFFSEVYFFWSLHPDERPSTPAVLAAHQPLHRQQKLISKLLRSIL